MTMKIDYCFGLIIIFLINLLSIYVNGIAITKEIISPNIAASIPTLENNIHLSL